MDDAQIEDERSLHVITKYNAVPTMVGHRSPARGGTKAWFPSIQHPFRAHPVFTELRPGGSKLSERRFRSLE